MNDLVDIAIIGAGLAGSSAAIFAAQSGARVLLLESDVAGRHKVCGEFLSPESRNQLQQLGVLQKLEEAGAQSVSTARVCTSTRRGKPITLPGEGLAISRATLDATLWHQALEVGVCARDHTRVTDLERQDDGTFQLQTSKGEVNAKYVISAAGRTSRWSREVPPTSHDGGRFVGLKTHFHNVNLETGQVVMFPFEGGYCGLVKVEGERVNACLLAPYSRLKNSSPAILWAQIRQENKALDEAVQNADMLFSWKATGNVSFSQFAPVQDGVLRIGDAAGYIHPLSGDGMAMALRSGELVAHTTKQALSAQWSTDKAAEIYARLWQREFGSRLSWAGALQPLFCNSLVANTAIRVVDALPVLSHLAARRTRGRVAT